MNISILGLGYVGCVNAACLAGNGHDVTGVDLNPIKIDLINSGKPTVIEKGIDEMVSDAYKLGKLRATKDCVNAVFNTDISITTVGTPIGKDGNLDLTSVFKVAEQIGKGIKKKKDFHLIIIRSTVTPGTNKEVSDIIERSSQKRKGKDFDVITNPEFLREGSSLYDYYNPPMIVVGGGTERSFVLFKKLYKDIDSKIIRVKPEIAEFIKFVNNSFHALKVSFANEIGDICKKMGIDSHEVMELFCADKTLNISSYYLKPGPSYGGSCLPKDLEALNTMAKKNKSNNRLLDAIDKSNEEHKNSIIDLIIGTNKDKIGIFGLGFKKGTDDLRNSPVLDIITALQNKRFEVCIYDKYIKEKNLTGSNKNYLSKKNPEILGMIKDDINFVASASDVFVICTKESEFIDLMIEYPGKVVIDLVRLAYNIDYDGRYKGICW